MATPPTLVASTSTTWNAATSPRSAAAALAASVGDVISGLAVKANNDVGAVDFTFGPGTWVEQAINQGGSGANTGSGSPAQTAAQVQASAGSVTPTIAASIATNSFGAAFIQHTGSDGIGASNQGNSGVANSAMSLGLTTTADNSAIVCLFVDWNAAAAATRTWAQVNGISPTEIIYYQNSTDYAVFVAVWPDAGAAGAKTLGITLPTSPRWTGVALEVKGSAAPPPPPGEGSYNNDATDQMWSYTGMGYNDGSLL